MSFGVFLLNDGTGSMIAAMRAKNHDHNTRDIFQEWLRGSGAQPVTWRTLVAVLREAHLSTLADEIETAIRERGGQTETGEKGWDSIQ